jgi:ribonuclease VapC
VIVDTSALVAVARREDGYAPILRALVTEPAALPAPALLEFRRVTASKGNAPSAAADALIADLIDAGLTVVPFDAEHAELAAAANEAHGTGNGRGGPLNLLDLMVYAVAKATARPILCTGRDFAATDAVLHPASRPW